MRFVHAVRDAGLRRAVVSSSANCREVLEAAGIADLFEERVDGIVAEREHLRGQAGAGHVPRRGARRSASTPAAAAVFEDALAGRRRGPSGRLRPRRRGRPRRPGRRAAASTAPTSSSATSPSCSTPHDHAPELRGRARGRCARPSLDLDVLAQTESVFALSNGHIGLRGEPGRRRAVRPARARTSTRSTSCGRSRTPRPATATRSPARRSSTSPNGKIIRLLVDDEPFDVRYGQLLAHERVLDLRAGVLRRRVEWRSPAGTAVRVRSTRLVSFVQRAVAAILYEVEPLGRRRCASSSSPSSSRTSPRRPQRDRPARRRGARVAARRRTSPSTATVRAVLVHSTRSSKLGLGGRDGPRRRRARTAPSVDGESAADVGRVTVAADLAPGERLEHREVPRLRLVEPALASRRSATRSSPRSPRRGTPGWDGLVAGQRAYLDEFWDRADVELDGRHRASAGRALRALPHAPGRRPRRAARDRRQGPDRPRLRRPHVLGHRALRPAGAHLHRAARRPATRCAGGTRRSTSPASAPRQLGLAGAAFPVADDPRAGMLGLLAGRHGGVPHQRRHRRRRRPLPARDRRRGLRARGRPRAARRDGPAVALARPPRRARAASASTASPAPTSTARSPTTTSTRT